MAEPPTANVICFGDLKQAAVYFDRVLPVAVSLIRGDGVRAWLDAPDPIPFSVAAELIFGPGTPAWRMIHYIDDHWSKFLDATMRYRTPTGSGPMEPVYEDLKALYLANASSEELGSIRAAFADFGRSIGLDNVCVLLDGNASGACRLYLPSPIPDESPDLRCA